MSFSEPSPVLIFDTLHMIISHLRVPKDNKTLCTCSLVCKLWHSVARKQLFSELTTVPPDHPDPNPELGLHHPRMHARWASFSPMVQSNISLVTRLRIMHDFYRDLWLEDLSYLLPSFPSLRQIELASVWLCVSRPQDATAASNRPLDSLEFTNSAFDLDTITTYMAVFHLARFISFQSAFIRDMDLWKERMDRTETLLLDSSPSFGPNSLSILKTETHATALLLDFFEHTRAVHTLRFLRIGCLHLSHTHYKLARLISSLTRLETVEYDSRHELGPMTASESDVTAVMESFERNFGTTLSAHRTLRTFSLYPPDVPADHVWWTLAFFFIRSMPATMAHLELHLGSCLVIDFEALKGAMVHFEGLKSVKIYADNSAICRLEQEPGMESFEACLRGRLPEVSKRGALQTMIENW